MMQLVSFRNENLYQKRNALTFNSFATHAATELHLFLQENAQLR